MKQVIYGAPGSGKTRHAQQLVAHFQAKGVMDEWDGQTEIPDGYIALTNVPVAGAINIEDVLPLLSVQN